VTALHRAAIYGNSGLIGFFIGKGANALKPDVTESNVLHLAVDNGKHLINIHSNIQLAYKN
jgi:ankyrin repeat protein